MINRTLVAVLLLVCQDARSEPLKADLTIATLNTHNLALPGQRVYFSEVTQETYKNKIDWLAQLLGRTDADIVALQEVWAKEAVQDAIKRGGLEYEVVYFPDSRLLSSSVVLVRAPWLIESQESVREFPPSFVMTTTPTGEVPEPAITVKVNAFAHPVVVMKIAHSERPDVPSIHFFAAKLKSLLPTRLSRDAEQAIGSRDLVNVVGSGLTQVRRTAETIALRMLVQSSLDDDGSPVVVLGDFSEASDSQTLELLTQARDKFGAASQGVPGDRGQYGKALFSTIQLQQVRSGRDFAYTYESRGKKVLLDDILVSEEFLKIGKDPDWSLIRLDIINDHLKERRSAGPTSATSDHGVVVAHFQHTRR